MLTLLIALLAYLLGSVSSAVLVSRGLNLPDPRTYGSGELTAINLLQSNHRLAGFLTLLLDALKGGLAVWLGSTVAAQFPDKGLLLTSNDAEIICAALLGVVLGQTFPAYRKFKGNSSVATALGAFILMRPVVGMTIFTLWFVALCTVRYVSVAGLAMAAGAPLVCWAYYEGDIHTTTALIVGLLIVWQHRSNIVNLLRGTEPRVGRGLND